MQHHSEIVDSGRVISALQCHFRPPRAEDGPAVWQLVRQSGSLDENSMYCNLLQCTDFAATCAIADNNGTPMGWVSAYIPPNEPGTLFVWQVCVSEQARGQGLAAALIASVLSRDTCANVKRLKTTITKDNEASWAAFRKLADRYNAKIDHAPHFDSHTHFSGHHATEHMLTIGPLDPPQPPGPKTSVVTA